MTRISGFRRSRAISFEAALSNEEIDDVIDAITGF
jgi:hypothetical protein